MIHINYVGTYKYYTEKTASHACNCYQLIYDILATSVICDSVKPYNTYVFYHYKTLEFSNFDKCIHCIVINYPVIL